MKFLAISIILLCVYNICNAAGDEDPESQDELEGYYWRRYVNEIPQDALPGGRDMYGQTTYIGQYLYNGILIPGQFIVGERKLYFEWGNAEKMTEQNIKILCTKHPEQFEWIRTNTSTIGKIPNKNFILGGFESDFTIYIGRVAIGDTLSIGKVIFTGDNRKANGFHVTCRFNASFVVTQDFEILNYEPAIPKINKIQEDLKKRGLVKNSANKIQNNVFGSVILLIISMRFI